MSPSELRHVSMLMIELRNGVAPVRQREIADTISAITKIYLDRLGPQSEAGKTNAAA